MIQEKKHLVPDKAGIRQKYPEQPEARRPWSFRAEESKTLTYILVESGLFKHDHIFGHVNFTPAQPRLLPHHLAYFRRKQNRQSESPKLETRYA